MNKWIYIAEISITVITEVISMMKDIEKVYIIREDDVDLSYYVMLLPEEY
ncbi:hypothetical protein ACPKFX_11575 [Mammaliicoccus sciuri]